MEMGPTMEVATSGGATSDLGSERLEGLEHASAGSVASRRSSCDGIESAHTYTSFPTSPFPASAAPRGLSGMLQAAQHEIEGLQDVVRQQMAAYEELSEQEGEL